MKKPARISQSFSGPELEAAARALELILAGGDPRVALTKTDAGREFTRKIFAMRKAHRDGVRIADTDVTLEASA